jgi:hypothetical protein
MQLVILLIYESTSTNIPDKVPLIKKPMDAIHSAESNNILYELDNFSK